LALSQTTDDLEKTDLLLEIADLQMGSSLDESQQSAENALNLAQKLNDKERIGKAYTWISRVLSEKNNYQEALSTIAKAERAFLSIPDSFYLGNVYNVFGIIYKRDNQINKAIEYQYKAAQMAEAVQNDNMAASAYNSLGNLYSSLRDEKTAMNFYQQAIKFVERSGQKRSLTGLYLNMANMVDDSIPYKMELYQKAVALAEENGFNRELGYIYCGLAMHYADNGNNLDSTIHYHEKGIASSINANDNYMKSYNELYLGVAQLEKGNSAQAEQLLKNSLENEYILGDPLLNAEVHYYLSKSRADQSDFKAAYSFLDTALVRYRRNYDEQILNTSADANAKFETEKKEKELTEQALEIERQKNNRNLILLIAALLLGFIALVAQYFINRQKRLKKEAELAFSIEKQRAEDLEELSNVKTNLFNNISHELRTPLTMIIGPLQEAEKKIQNVPLKNDIHLALTNSKRLTGLINEILDLSKLDAGKLTKDESEVRLYSFLKRIFYAYASLADSRKVILEDNLEKSDVGLRSLMITTDVQKLEKILNNLISNAIKFSKTGDTVTLELNKVKLESEILYLSILDQGPGVPNDEKENIFDRYYQSKSTSHLAGTGIGLALVQELCEFLGGTVCINDRKDTGSIFTIEIPVKTKIKSVETEEISHSEQDKSEVSPLHINGDKPQLLIVEDDLQMSRYLKNLLSKNYDCTIAFNGKQALQLLEKQQFDLISSDIMMPEMDGFAFKEEVNRMAQHKNTAFIMLTAKVLEEDRLRGFKLGIDDYITKPFSAEEFKARIYALIKNKIKRSEEVTEISFEESLISEAQRTVMTHLDEPDYRVEDLAKTMNYSSRQLARILKKATGLSPVEFILEIRLQQAYRIIQERKFSTINEVRYGVGIESPSYFSNKFKERFGVNPSDLAAA
jgi:signal transduction histidine kinase/DNA-binding response OmpR family regulator